MSFVARFAEISTVLFQMKRDNHLCRKTAFHFMYFAEESIFELSLWKIAKIL